MSRKNHFLTYFMLNQIFFSACGLWPFQNVIFKKIFRYFWTTQQLILLVAKLIKLYEIKSDTDIMIEAVAAFSYNVMVTVKFINGVINEEKINNILKKIQSDWNNLTDNSEIEILSHYARSGKFLSTLFISTAYTTLLSYMLLPLSPIILDFIQPLNESRPREPIMMVEFYIDQDRYYYSMLIYAYFTILYGIIPFFGSDAFILNGISHACGMFDILGQRIKNILKTEEYNKNLDYMAHRKLVNCIYLHQEIIQFCNEINEGFSTSFLVVIFLSITMMSFTGVATVINIFDDFNFNNIIRFGMFTMAQIFHLFCYNYTGQKILNAGDNFRNELYNSTWYDSPIKIQQLIRFMVLRNSKPPMLKTGLFLLSLPSFTYVMKTSMSYFTALQSTR